MGCQWAGLGKCIMEMKVIKESLDKSASILQTFQFDLFRALIEEDDLKMDNIMVVNIVIVAVQIALVDLFNDLDVIPDIIIGHSLGELVSAYCDGCLSHEQVILMAYYR